LAIFRKDNPLAIAAVIEAVM